MMKSKLYLSVSAALALVMMFLSACSAPSPEPSAPVIQTVIVEKEVPVEQKIIQTVVVEKQVEKTVEKTVVVTPDVSQPVKGGTYVTAFGGSMQPFEAAPFPWGSGAQTRHWQLAFNALAELDESLMNWTPALAESWQLSSDGTELTFKLRDGAKWQDGQPITADDVLFSAQSWLQIADAYVPGFTDVVKGAKDFAEGKTDQLAGVTVVDPATVKFTFEKPQVLDDVMAIINNQPIAPKHQWDGKIKAGMTLADIGKLPEASAPIGSGPFQVTNFNPEQVVEYKKFPGYFRGEPLLDGVVLRLYGSETPVANGLESEEIHAAALWGKENWPHLFLADDLRVWVDPITGGLFRLDLNMRPERPDSPLQDARFRQALMYAIPRSKIADSLRLSVSKPALSLVNSPVYTEGLDLTDYEYNPEKAKALLAEMGYDAANAPELTLSTTQFDNGPELTGIQQALADVGIKMKIFVVERAGRPALWADANAWDMHYQYQASPGTDLNAISLLQQLEGCQKPLGECEWQGSLTWKQPEAYDKIVTTLSTETDPAKRKELIKQAMGILDKEVPFAWLWTEPNVYFVNNRVHGQSQGVPRYGTFNGMPNAGAETWWVEPAE